jgi:hypothetical protein
MCAAQPDDASAYDDNLHGAITVGVKLFHVRGSEHRPRKVRVNGSSRVDRAFGE